MVKNVEDLGVVGKGIDLTTQYDRSVRDYETNGC
jgi:hypothetical protein